MILSVEEGLVSHIFLFCTKYLFENSKANHQMGKRVDTARFEKILLRNLESSFQYKSFTKTKELVISWNTCSISMHVVVIKKKENIQFTAFWNMCNITNYFQKLTSAANC